MSETQQGRFAIYDAMTTEELEEILRADFDGAESDEELILHIMDTLAQRKRTHNPGKTAREGWESFQAHYVPTEIKQAKTVTGRLWLIRFAAAAAAVVLLVVFPLTAKSLGWGDMWDAVTQWARDTFSTSTDATQPTETDPIHRPLPPPATPTQPESTEPSLPPPLEQVENNGLIFNLNREKTGYEVIYRSEKPLTGTLVIPSACNGLPVVAIGQNAFIRQTELTGIVIPGSITEIQSCAFEKCTSLKDVTLSEGLLVIGGNAFKECSALTEIVFPDTLVNIDTGAFRRTGLISVEIPGRVYLSNLVFSECTALKKVTLHEGLTELGSYLFSGCTSLSEINIPNSVRIIWDRTFRNCTSLTSITLPRYLTRLDGYVFDGCSNLTSVAILGRITTLYDNLFPQCSGLTDITIPSSVTTIESGTFADCINLKNIYYDGTQEQWDATTVGARNDSLFHANLHLVGQCATGHFWDIGTITRPATCDREGAKYFTCIVCGTIRNEIIPKPAEHTWNSGVVTKKPVCLEAEGEQTCHCDTCDAPKVEPIPIPEAHTWDTGKLTKWPVCGETEGEWTYICTLCGITKADPYPMAKRHTWSETSEVTKEPTCAQEGVRTSHCINCGLVKNTTIPKLITHRWNQGSLIKAPTCQEKGQWAIRCALCGEIKDAKTVVKQEHKPGPDATLINPQTCTECGKILTPAKLPLKNILRYLTPALAALLAAGIAALFIIQKWRKSKTS